MTVGQRHKGRVLQGTLIEVPFKMTGIMTILEDSAGDVITLAIYHAAGSSASNATVEAMFPMGMRLAIKEPYLKVGVSGRLVVRVDNPADIVELGPVTREEEAGSDNSMKTVQSLREEGKRYFSAEQWDRAIQAYSRCLQILEVKASCPEVVEQFAVVYSNRAEAWLRLNHHGNALEDALKSLERDKSNIRSLVRKAKALYGLRCYQEAIQCLQNLIRQKPPLHPQTRRELIELLKGVEMSDKQSRLGIYDMNSFFRSGTQKALRGKVCDFVGPVEVRKVDSDNPARGRGLFTTKDVKAGDLHLVSNALAVGDSNPNREPGFYFTKTYKVYRHSTEDLITRLVGVVKRNSFRRKQLYLLSDSTLASVSEVPPMTMLTPPSNSTEALAMAAEQQNAEEEVDVARVRRIVEVNAFQASQAREDHDMDTTSGLWVLSSLINHSCVPNAQRSGPGVGDVMFIRAIRDIRKGEVTMLYCCGHQTILQRDSILNGHFNFDCWCPRCLFERSFAKTVPELTGLAEDSASLLKKDTKAPIAEVIAAGSRIATAVEEILSQAPEHDAEKKNWIRASFRRACMCQASQLMRVAMKTCDWEPWTEAMNSGFEMMLSVVPDEQVLAHVCNAIHHLPVWKTCRAKWTQLAKRMWTFIFGPLDNNCLNAQVKIFSQVPLFPPMDMDATTSR